MSELCGADEQSAESAYLVRGDKVTDEEQDVHNGVLRDGDDVRAGDLEHLDAAGSGGVEVDVVRADTGGDAGLEVLGLQ